MDGYGGGDCVEADGSQLYRAPSTMVNYWATSEADEAAFSSWCYQTSLSNVKSAMAIVKSNTQP